MLQEAGAIRECEDHGWMQDRDDPHARDRALCIGLENPLFDVSTEEAIAAVKDVLDSIGDTCPECPPTLSAPAAISRRPTELGCTCGAGYLVAATATTSRTSVRCLWKP